MGWGGFALEIIEHPLRELFGRHHDRGGLELIHLVNRQRFLDGFGLVRSQCSGVADGQQPRPRWVAGLAGVSRIGAAYLQPPCRLRPVEGGGDQGPVQDPRDVGPPAGGGLDHGVVGHDPVGGGVQV